MAVMKTKERPPTRSELKHAAILDAAAHEFRVGGFAATSMDRIAERAEVSKRTVYNHFANKDALFEAILEVLWDRARRATEIDYDAESPLEDQLGALAHRKLDVLADPNYLGLARALVAEAIRSPGFLQEKWAQLAEEEVGLPRWIQSAAADGRLLVEDATEAAEQFMVLLKGFAFWPQVVGVVEPPTTKQRRQITASVVELFLARYRSEKR
jgi:TetR/AcrR family transcriptional regulator of autoinduction and epiphytic fitness